MFLTNENAEVVACILLGKKLCNIAFAIKGPVSPLMHCAPRASLIDFLQLKIIEK